MRKFIEWFRPTEADLELAEAIKAYPARSSSAMIVLPKSKKPRRDR